MDASTVILFGVIFLIIAIGFLVGFLEHHRSGKMNGSSGHTISDAYSILHERDKRLQFLEKSMDTLFKEHKVIAKISDVYDLIPKYVLCRDETEKEYCRDYLRKLYSSGYMRYDDERTK